MEAVQLKTKDGRLVGTLKGMVFAKTVQGSKHLFRKIGANGSWGIDLEVLTKQLPERASVRITDTENGILYMASVARWKEYGEIKHFKEETIDHYTQIFLPLEYFDKVKTNGL